MKKTIALGLLACGLVIIFTVGLTTASFDSGKSAVLSGYKSGSGGSKLTTSSTYSGLVKPDFHLLPKETNMFWDPAFMNQTRQEAQTGSQSTFGPYMFRPTWSGGCPCCG